MLLALLLLVPLTALGLVLGMGRLEESLLAAPVAGTDDAAPAAVPAAAADRVMVGA